MYCYCNQTSLMAVSNTSTVECDQVDGDEYQKLLFAWP